LKEIIDHFLGNTNEESQTKENRSSLTIELQADKKKVFSITSLDLAFDFHSCIVLTFSDMSTVKKLAHMEYLAWRH
jgi:hypothetical protein